MYSSPRPTATLQHHPKLLELLAAPIPVDELSQIIGASIASLVAVPSPDYSSPSLNPDLSSAPPKLPSVEAFARHVARRTRCSTGVLLAVFVYVRRLKIIMPPTASGRVPSTHLRIFLGCFVLASKYLHDRTYLNKDYAVTTSIFDLASVNCIERDLLTVLNYRIEISAHEITSQALAFLHVFPGILAREQDLADPSPRLRKRRRLSTPPNETLPFTPPPRSLLTLGSTWSDSDSSASPTPTPSLSPSSLGVDPLEHGYVPPPTPGPSQAPQLGSPIFNLPGTFPRTPSPFSQASTTNAERAESPLLTPPSSPPPPLDEGFYHQFEDELVYEGEGELEEGGWMEGKGMFALGRRHALKRKREADGEQQ